MSYTIATLKALALRGAANSHIPVSTKELGMELGVSQQTASNRLIAMERSGLIARRRGVHGQDIMITREGVSLLRKEFAEYRMIFEMPGTLKITGTISSGLGEGQYYLNKPGYRSQISEKLGFTPFDGTLNLKVAEAEMAKLSMVPPGSRIQISSFQADGRTYGDAECIPITIRGIGCAIIQPKRSHHSGVIEIISSEHLRTKLGVGDGDSIELTIPSQ